MLVIVMVLGRCIYGVGGRCRGTVEVVVIMVVVVMVVVVVGWCWSLSRVCW